MQKIHCRKVAAGVLLSLYGAFPALAEDIEIYTSIGQGAVPVKPNILFVLDNSGSMNRTVPDVRERYDFTGTYSGCFDENKIYYTQDGKRPECGSTQYFDVTDLHCDHAFDEYDASNNQISTLGPLEEWGTYADQMAQLSASYIWRQLEFDGRPVECAADAGVHGSNSSPNTARYIENSVAGWTSSVTSPSVWAAGKNNYTLYHGNYLNYLMDASVPTLANDPTRFEEVARAFEALIDTNTSINAGLLVFDEYNGANNLWGPINGIEGGRVAYPIEDINSGRTNIKAALAAVNVNTGTPLSEAYYEALRYFGGMDVDYGVLSEPPSVAASRSGDTYISPITDACQKNVIILLTDGLPWHDSLTTDRLGELPGYTEMACASTLRDPPIAQNCLVELAEWARNNDVIAGTSSATAGDQYITTHTVGFANGNLDDPDSLIVRTAAAGGGVFVPADNADELRSELNKIFAQTLEVNTTFTAPAVSVNAFNRATNLDDLYFTLFKPSQGSHWDGNLKKFKIAFDSNGDPVIEDANGNNAIDDTTGFFAANATSFWTDPGIQDGAEVALGGAAGKLTTTRNVYTITGGYANNAGVLVPSNGDLTSAVNALEVSNTAVTEAMLDIIGKPPLPGLSIPYRESLLDWAYGIDVLDDDKDGSVTDARGIMGDPLHSEPALVQYGELSGGEPDLVAYVATNDGYLHAFNTQDGTEYFAFVPQELLPLLDINFVDSGVLGKSYGLDGNVVAWVNDIDNDGQIEPGENIYLYIGMRRGGNNIYSLDVTDRNNPTLRWVIAGGVGDFAELNQTWSSVNVEKLRVSGSERTVLIFGGGYDTAQDVATMRTPDTRGRAIYIVDAETGQRLWWAGPSGSGADLELADMDYSIPARIKPLDMDGDGYVDRLYTGDMGGQLWRFDLPLDNLNNITGGRIADLAADGSLVDARRFYYPPDVSLIFEEGRAPYLAIVAASGYRAHPLNTDIHDRMYMIRDYDIYKAPASYVTVTEADLYDTTSNVIGEGTDAQITAATSALDAAKGWYISFNEIGSGNFIGEKSLSEPLILNGTAIVTTYIPDDLTGVVTNSCTPREGTGRVFYVNIQDGTPTYNNDGTIDMTRADRWTYLKRGGIPPSPNIIITEQGTGSCVGTECKKSLELDNIQKTYWYEKESD